MLNLHTPRRGAIRRRPAERGIVLFVALVVLAAMTLAAVSLMRSVLTGNRVAGNLAFQQSATQSADVGIERAIAWLQTTSAADETTLYNDITPAPGQFGYFASRTDPAPGQSWAAYWGTLVGTGRVNTLAVDAAGNQVSFAIQRLCNAAGAPTAGIGCAVAPTTIGSQGGSKGANVIQFQVSNQRYYRITARVSGPRNTVSFVQAVIAI